MKKNFKWYLPYNGHLGYVWNRLLFPLPISSTYEIWLWLTPWFLRWCLKSVDDGRAMKDWRTNDRACLYYKLTYEPKGSGELKNKNRTCQNHEMQPPQGTKRRKNKEETMTKQPTHKKPPTHEKEELQQRNRNGTVNRKLLEGMRGSIRFYSLETLPLILIKLQIKTHIRSAKESSASQWNTLITNIFTIQRKGLFSIYFCPKLILYRPKRFFKTHFNIIFYSISIFIF